MPDVFHRSLHRHGQRGMSISLPLAWLDRHGLKPRDRVGVIVKEELFIQPVPNRGKRALLRSLISGRPPNELRITLPISWLRHHDLKPGDKVKIIDTDELIVWPLPREGQGPSGEEKKGEARPAG